MFDLAPYNTFGLHVGAKNLVVVKDLASLENFDDERYLILGHGSDVLFTDDFEGTILVNAIRGIEITDDKDYYYIKVGGGEILDDLIVHLLNKSIVGLENLSKIPGTVGAAPVQNVGAYGVEIGDYIEQIDVFNLKTKQIIHLSQSQCEFDYRSSIFKTQRLCHYFISHVHLKIKKSNEFVLSYKELQELDVRDAFAIRNKVIALREAKLPDPRFIGNAGSFFKNPIIDEAKLKAIRKIYPNVPVFTYNDQKNYYKVAAGFLIDKAGLRGVTHGNAGTWEHQALVIVNRGRAKPHEIVALAKYIVAVVKDKFDIYLEPEVRIFGAKGEIQWQDI